MRAFVFLLILANLLFLAWSQGYLGSSSNPDSLRVQQQLLADQIRIVARDEPPAEMVKTESAAKTDEKKPVQACILVGDLPIAEIDRLESLLAEKWPAFKAERTKVTGSASYWVFIPPMASKQEADNKAAELKKLGIPEFYVVQESGPNNRAISLGLFSSREAATAHLEMLRAKGVNSARIAERNVKPLSAWLEINGPAALTESLRQALAEALPESKPGACNNQATSEQ
jgi:hypothetical protein